MDAKELAEKLAKYPKLKQRMEEMLAIVENTSEEILLADDAENRVIGVVRGMGQELMQGWAESRSNQASRQIEKIVTSAKKNIKKKSVGIQRLVK